MKKFLLVMVTVLALISLVACNQGISEEEAEKRTQAKLDETAATYSEFIKYRKFLEYELWTDILNEFGAYSSDTYDNKTITKIGSSQICRYAEFLNATDDNKAEASSGSFVEGTVSGTRKDATISNIKLKASYSVYNRENTKNPIKEETDDEISISSGSYKESYTGDENNATSTATMSATVNGTEYSISYTMHLNNGKNEYVSATVNGKEVAAKLLNSAKYNDDEWY